MKHHTNITGNLSEAAVRAAEDTGYVVMVFSDSKYSRLLENWLLFAECAEEKIPILICALDAPLANEMSERGYHACHVPWSGKISELWTIRVHAIRTVLSLGVDVVHSDADAVWRRSPVSFLRQNVSSDIVASQGTIWPPNALSNWGHVLCFGFVCFRSTEPTLWLLGQLAKAASRSKGFDDQRTLNNLLVKQGVEWERNCDTYELKKNGKAFRCYTKTIEGRANIPDGAELNVALLPHRLFQRLPNRVESGCPIVAHPVARRPEGSNSEAELRKVNCWRLSR